MFMPDSSRYETMRYARTGNSGLKLPRVSLGLWHNFGGVDSHEHARSMLHRAFDLGIVHFDLANNYGPPAGSAEQCLGKVLNSDLSRYRDELVISTKAGYQMWDGPYGEWGSRKYLLASLDQSLKRLGLPYVDIFYSHRPDPETPLEETMGALAHAVKSGKALYVGISNYDAAETARAIELLANLGTPCLIHQTKYNMFERQPEQALLPLLAQRQLGCIAFSPLAQGLLSNRYLGQVPEDSRAAKPHGFLERAALTQSRLDQVRRLNELARARGQSLAQMALAWVLRHPAMTSAVIGASRPEQIEAAVGALAQLGFSEEELHSIDGILAA